MMFPKTVFNIKLYSVQDDEEVILFDQKYEENLYVKDEYGYNKYFSSNIYNIEKLYLEVTYNIKDKEYSNTYPLTLKLNFESNRLFYKEQTKLTNNDNILFDIDKLYIDNLIAAGYKYNESDDTYIRNFENDEFIYYINPNYISYNYGNSRKQTEIKYYFNDKQLEVSEYDYNDNKLLIKFNYYLENNNIICTIGNCNDIDSYLNIVTEEIKEING